jgi:hypothetical protein
MSKKKKMGRPKILPGQRKQMFSIRFTVDQVVRFELAAKAKEMPLRAWITSTLTEASSNIL